MKPRHFKFFSILSQS